MIKYRFVVSTWKKRLIRKNLKTREKFLNIFRDRIMCGVFDNILTVD